MSTKWSKSLDEFTEFIRSGLRNDVPSESVEEDAIAVDTRVPHHLIADFYNENPTFEQTIPISTFEAVFGAPGRRFAKYGDVMELAKEFVQMYADVELLTERAGGRTTIEWRKFVPLVAELVGVIVEEIRGRPRDPDDNRDEEEIEKELDGYREYVMDYVRFVLLHETYAQQTERDEQDDKTLLSVYDIVHSGVLDDLREPTRCDWTNYDVFVLLRTCYDKLMTKSERGGIETAGGLAYDFSLSGSIVTFTPAFFSALWAHMERIGWVRDDLLMFREYLHVRRLLYYTNYKKGRRFLFDVLDFDMDGAIGHLDLVYFYRSLAIQYARVYPERYFPNEKEAIIAWLDQIAPNITPNLEWAAAERPVEQIYRITFEDVANHKFGADFLHALISCDGFDKVDFRYDAAAPEQDTEVDPEEAPPTITADELATLLGSTQTLVDDEDLANHRDLLHIELAED
ncbi:hypothetical protein M3Y99_00684000 [Aphelenchoides fujianensis]|nr:hypothetical protein M3Y99_00684000 [Aphelenchoides fujianensis]